MSRRPRRAPSSSDRSVSVALNYVLVLGITTILITGLLVAGGNFVGDNRERVIESELTVIGNHVAGNLEQVDRLANASKENLGEGPEVAYINQSFQRQVTGSTYSIEVLDGSSTQVVLRAVDPEVTVRVNATVRNDVRSSTVGSGSISVSYDSDADEVVMTDA